MTDSSILSAVGRTAVAVALARALESDHEDPWFDDALARGMAARITEVRLGEGVEPPRIRDGLRNWVAVRTRFLDELVVDAVAEGERQVVIVGAGLDARAFRLPVPDDTAFFEIDREDVVAVKDRIVSAAGLRPRGSRAMIVADVLEPDWINALTAAGWRANRATVWILEGFLVYFGRDVRTRLLTQLASVSASGSRLGATVSTRRDDPDRPLWHSFEGVDFVSWFAECGWDASVTTMAERSAAYGRAVTADDADHLFGALVDARLGA